MRFYLIPIKPLSALDSFRILAYFPTKAVLMPKTLPSTHLLGEVSSPSKNSDIFCPISMDEGVHISTCSHTMHSKCYNTFIDSLNARERSRPRQQSLNSRMINHEAGEFLCVCVNDSAIVPYLSCLLLSNKKKWSKAP
uniref:RING-type E3 ubiquitin transferase n=1 Tax=Ditylenchus dipsaci TaxID=166011 RepID=A0A915EGS8_9BILA